MKAKIERWSWPICFLCLVLVVFIFPYVLFGAKTHSLMLNENNHNATPISTLYISQKVQVGGVSLFSTEPTAGHFLRVDSAGTGIEGIPITSSVTGSGGVEAGAYKSIAYYPASAGASGATVGPLGQLANATLSTDSASLPALSQTLPNAVQTNITKLGDLSQGLTGTTLHARTGATVDGRANLNNGVSGYGDFRWRGGVSATELTSDKGITAVTAYANEVTAAQRVNTAGVSPLSSNSSFVLGGVYQVSYESMKWAGKAGITVMTTYLESPASSSGNTCVVTLDNGVTGQMKHFAFLNDGGADIHLKPANLRAGTSIWFTHAGYGCTLIFDGMKWNVIGKAGVTVL